MGCLKAGVVANVGADRGLCVRDALRVPADFCEGGDPESKGIVEALVGYAKRDLVVPVEPFGRRSARGQRRCRRVARSTPQCT